ncbi:MAG: hypothetical protein HY399_07660, partial [Elusimicrobia bacterium]|nr:hypothetical protein [Elusimicrobiota bacterium]
MKKLIAMTLSLAIPGSGSAQYISKPSIQKTVSTRTGAVVFNPGQVFLSPAASFPSFNSPINIQPASLSSTRQNSGRSVVAHTRSAILHSAPLASQHSLLGTIQGQVAKTSPRALEKIPLVESHAAAGRMLGERTGVVSAQENVEITGVSGSSIFAFESIPTLPYHPLGRQTERRGETTSSISSQSRPSFSPSPHTLPLQFLHNAKKSWNRRAVADSTGKDLTYGKTLTASIILA